MPKSSPSLSSNDYHSNSKMSSEDPRMRPSDVALRKKKNADAQAAFRARRANYIATLEETVTSLESVVLQLQESCREARGEATELRLDNVRLRQELREREKLWKGLLQSRKPGQPEMEDAPPMPPSFSHLHPQATGLNAHLGGPNANSYPSDGLSYRSNDESPGSACNGPYNVDQNQNYAAHSPTLSYQENNHVPDGSTHVMAQKVQKYGPYPFNVQSSHRDGSWSHQVIQAGSSGGEPGTHGDSTPTHSSAFASSSTLTSNEMNYISRYEDQKVQVNNLGSAPYVFPASRSLSPQNSTPTSSTSLAAPFQFTFPDTLSPNERSDFDYRRHPNAHGTEVTLHGGTADISLAGPGSEAVRYRIGPRRNNSVPERTLHPSLTQISGSDANSQHDRAGSSEGENNPYPFVRQRRETLPSHTSRSPSPSTTPISGTLAVIKAQAFGALRRTRTRPKRTSEGAARVALDVLEANGMNPTVKRARLDSEESDIP